MVPVLEGGVTPDMLPGDHPALGVEVEGPG